MPLRAILALTLAAGLTACGAQRHAPRPSSTLTAFSRGAPPQDAFTGHVVRATGRLAGDSGSLRIDLHPAGGSGTRKLVVTVASPPCHGARHCLALAGTLKGTLRQEAPRPDRGRTSVLRVSGALRPLGHTSGAGFVTGTGNVRFGHESLVLTLTGRPGTVGIVARSGPVPGFTSP